MTNPDLEGIAAMKGCGAFFGHLTRHLLAGALIVTALLTGGVIAGICWTVAVFYALFLSANTGRHVYRRTLAASSHNRPVVKTIKTSR
ncbi:hypothetical protein [Nonomuraea dietziae]|uniref:hypothetical protein n=1 Tax=Nonomuraea dietziae TaxID=65515 RepID=UPI0033F6E34A